MRQSSGGKPVSQAETLSLARQIMLVFPKLLVIFFVHLSWANDEEFGIEPHENEDKDNAFETKAHLDPGTFYYVINQDNSGLTHVASSTGTVQAPQQSSRPVWRPVFNSFGYNSKPVQSSQSWPRFQSSASAQPQSPLFVNRSPTLPTLPPLTPQDLPEQLRLLGYNIIADLIERADLTEALNSRGPFTVFAPTDDAFRRFIGERGDEYEDVILGDRTLLQYILLQHVVPERYRSTDLYNGMQIKTLADNTMTIIDTRDGLSISGALFWSRGLNQIAMNGIIHAIQDVIYPYVSDEEATTTPSPASNNNRNFYQRSDDPKLVVRTDKGRVRGVNINPNVRAWLGIPYAEPPVDRYRFARPRSIKAWDNNFIKDTAQLPNACPQTLDSFFGNFSGSQQWNPKTPISEDCLYLNVYAPKDIEDNEKLPVLVWIYGGGYMTGSSALNLYNPQELVKLGRIIFVSMQYRVGAHGFLYFGKDSSAPGNVGLLDQTLALEWVRDNIKYFGGNHQEVTIMGESAGANSVALHMMSPLSCGLFKRAILQSAGATPRWGFVTREEALKRSIKLAAELQCDFDRNRVENTVECMRNKRSSDITSFEYYVDDYSLNFFPFVPTLDETFLPQSPRTMLKNANFKQVSVLIGSNANEGFYGLMYLLPEVFPNNEMKMVDMDISEDRYQDIVDKIFSFYPKPMRTLVAHEYRDAFEGQNKLFKALDKMAGDVDMTCNTEEFAQLLAQAGNRVYRYFYNHQSSVDPWPTWSGSKHGDEIEFAFGIPLQYPKQYSASEIKLARDMMTYWTNFVKNGSPNPSNSWATWPEYKAPEWRYLNLTQGFTGLTGMEKLATDCKFFTDVVPQFIPNVEDTTDNSYRGSTRLTCQ